MQVWLWLALGAFVMAAAGVCVLVAGLWFWLVELVKGWWRPRG